MSSTNGFPWQKTAKNLIRHAQKYQYTNNEFERQVGYLLLDVGVETLFRVYVTLPEIEAKGYKKRERIAKGTIETKNIQGNEITSSGFDELAFHTLAETVKQIAGEKVNKDDLHKVEYFHNIRNKIYHLGDGIVPTKDNFEEYLRLAERLLETLLTTNKQSEDHLTDDEWFLRHIEDAKFKVVAKQLQKYLQVFQFNVGVAAEVFAPQTTTKRVEKGIKQIKQKYGDDEEISMSERYGRQLIRIQAFQKLTGTDFDDGEFIDEALKDITYLHLVILVDHEVVDDNDIDNYLRYRDLVEMFHSSPDDIPEVLKEEILQLQGWAKKIEEKLDALSSKEKSDSQKEED